MEWNPWRDDELIGMRRATVVLAMLAFPAVAVAEGPSASFSVSPENPRSGDAMSLASSSCDPDGRLVGEAWDLDGDGAYDDAEGHAARTIFTAPGAHFVGLQLYREGRGRVPEIAGKVTRNPHPAGC